ncbi:MAG: hypothetical protein WCC17_19545 [Candidatus Nitrosopolaris sp.]
MVIRFKDTDFDGTVHDMPLSTDIPRPYSIEEIEQLNHLYVFEYDDYLI